MADELNLARQYRTKAAQHRSQAEAATPKSRDSLLRLAESYEALATYFENNPMKAVSIG